MKKLLVLGATGMAGHIVYTYFKEKNEYEMYNACFRNRFTNDSFIINVRNESTVKELFENIKPDVVINCIGILIKGSKTSPENAIYVNAYFPHMISRILRQVNPSGKVIHISTDCVFSGLKGSYSDKDVKDALDIYGMSKNLGELNNEQDLTIRTSIIGPELKSNGEGLFHWIFSQREHGTLNGFTKSIWGGVTTLELSSVIDFCIENNITGLYQASNNTPITKHDLVKTIIDEFSLPIKVNQIDGVISDKSILNTDLKGTEYHVSSYNVMLKHLHEFMNKHIDLYKQYLGE